MIVPLTVSDFKFDLVAFDKDEELFENYLKTEEEFGLSKKIVEETPDTPTDAYIAGLTNFKNKRPFVFINLTRWLGDDDDGLVAHECFHLTMLRYDWDMKKIEDHEEDAAQFQQDCFVIITKTLRDSLSE